MDNLNVHHYDGGEILEDWLNEMGIELLYTPVYSPDLNPIESCFGKVKVVLNGQLQQIVQENLKLQSVTKYVDRLGRDCNKSPPPPPPIQCC